MSYYPIEDLKVEGDTTEVYVSDDYMTMTTFEAYDDGEMSESSIMMSKEEAVKFAKWILEWCDE